MLTHSLNPFVTYNRFFDAGYNLLVSNHNLSSPDESGSIPDQDRRLVSPHKLVNHQLFNRLEKNVNTGGLRSQKVNTDEFSPTAIADRIIGFVAQGLGNYRNARPEADDSGYFSQVRQGIEQGFSDARDILRSLGLFQKQVVDEIDETYSLINEGLDRLQQAVQQSTNQNITSSAQYQGVAVKSSRTTEISIQTKEGDSVTISLNQSFESGRSGYQFETGGIRISEFEKHRSYNSILNISVDGNLNDKELKEVNHLLKKINKVANRFFHGNVKGAFRHALKLGLDTSQISSFSVDLTTEKSIQAVTAYQQTSQNGQGDTSISLIKQAADFINGAKELLNQSYSALNSFEDPKSSFSELFKEIGQLANDNSKNHRAIEDQQSFGQIVDHLADSIDIGNSAEHERIAA